MPWVYRNSYTGPNRRMGRFTVRFLERRGDEDIGTRVSVQSALRDLKERGMRWVDHFNYFGPDRRAEDFSFFFLERRKSTDAVGHPPALHAALRQVRVRLLDLGDAADRHSLRERILATAMLADANGKVAIGDVLLRMAHQLDTPVEAGDPRQALHEALNRAEAMLA